MSHGSYFDQKNIKDEGRGGGQTGNAIYLAKETNVPLQAGIKITDSLSASVPWRYSNAFSFRPNSDVIRTDSLHLHFTLISRPK